MSIEITDFPIFKDIPVKELNSILAPLRIRHFKKNHTLMFENDIHEQVYFISSGILKVYRMHQGREIVLGIITPGDIMGEIEILADLDYSISSIEVLDDVSAWMISKQDFLKIIDLYPSIYKHAYGMLANRLRVLNRLIRYLAFYDVRGKTANLLMDLYYNFGKNNANSGVIKLKLNQTVLANMLGISRESMSTTLADLRNEGIIDIRDKALYILDEEGLELICDEAEEESSHRKWRTL